MVNCKGPAKGQVKTNKDSKLQQKLKELFPDYLNEYNESLMYDELFSQDFIDFFGDWTSKDKYWVAYFKEPENAATLNDQGEPIVRERNGVVYIPNGIGDIYSFNENNLSQKDKLELINSLSLMYSSRASEKPETFIKKTLKERLDGLIQELGDVEDFLEKNSRNLDVSEKEMIRMEDLEHRLRKAIVALRDGILDNEKNFNSIVEGLENTLAGVNLRYIDDISDKEDELQVRDDILNYIKESNETRDTNNISAELKYIISSIYLMDSLPGGITEQRRASLTGFPLAVSANEVKNLLVENLSNIIETELSKGNQVKSAYGLMLEKLEERVEETENYILSSVLEKIKETENSKTGLDLNAFKVGFVNSFYKSQNIFTITEYTETKEDLKIRIIDPASTQDKISVISTEIAREVLEHFRYDNKESKNKNGEVIDFMVGEVGLNINSVSDLSKLFKNLNIKLNEKTVELLFNNRDNVLKNITKSDTLNLRELIIGKQTENGYGLLGEILSFQDYTKGSPVTATTKGILKTAQKFTYSDLTTQSEILRALTDRNKNTFFNILAKYESLNRTDIGDSSLFVGDKQRWMYSLMSGINKEILLWKSGNVKKLEALQHKNLTYVNYLLALDIKEEEKRRIESKKRIEKLQLITNSEIKKTQDNSPIQHKEIGEADLHMDIFAKMFQHLDSINIKSKNKSSKNTEFEKRLAEDTKTIMPYLFSADKSGSFSIYGLLSQVGNVEIMNDDISSLGIENKKILRNYILGEIETFRRHASIVSAYENEKSLVKKQEILFTKLVPGFHYVSSRDLEDKNNVLTAEEINAGTWNKFNVLNSLQKNSLIYRSLTEISESGVIYPLGNITKFNTNVDKATDYLESVVINILKKDVKYLDDIVIRKNEKGQETKLFDLPTSIEGSTTVRSKYNYAFTSLINNIEMFALFNGNVSMYKQDKPKDFKHISMKDALKRGPAPLSDGLYPVYLEEKTAQYSTFNNKKVEFDRDKKTIVAVVKNLENKNSVYSNIIAKALGKEFIDYSHEVADAGAYITVGFYKHIASRVFGWTENDEAMFKKVNDPKSKIGPDEIAWLQGTSKSLQNLKLTGFSNVEIKNLNNETIDYMATYLKYSTAVLAPAIVAGTELEKLAKQMEKQGVDQVLFKSGSKGSNRQETNIYNLDENGVFSGLKNDLKLNPFEFNMSDIKLQVELPTKFDKEGILGNQHLKNLLGNLDLNSPEKNYEYKGVKYTAKEINDIYQNNVKDILQDQFREFREKLNINIKDGRINLSDQEWQQKLRNLIVDQLDVVNDGDLIDIISDPTIPLETIPGFAQRAFPVVAANIFKNVGKVRINAAGAIQIANIGYDKILEVSESNQVIFLTKDTKLKPPLPITVKDLTSTQKAKLTEKDIKDDDIVYFNYEYVTDSNYETVEIENVSLDKTKGKAKISKAKIMLPFASISKNTNMSYEELSQFIKDNKDDPQFMKIFSNIIGYRIPNQSISSNDAIEIVGILPPTMGDSAVVYHEITKKTGSDFDIDKMYLMMPNFDVKRNRDKSLKAIHYSVGKSKKAKQNNLIEAMVSILTSPATYDDLMSPLDNDIMKDSILEESYLKAKKLNQGLTFEQYKESRNLDALSQMSITNLVKSRVDMLQAKKLVATMANHMTDIPMSQIVNQIFKFDLKLGSSSFALKEVLGKMGDPDYKLTKMVSYLMNAAVDAAKDNYIIEGNFNSYTANAAMILFRMGIDPKNVFKVLMNDSIVELSKYKQLQTQKITSINQDDFSQEKLNEASKEALIKLANMKTINYNIFSENKIEDKVFILGVWNLLQLAGKELNNEIVSSKPDSNGAGKNIYEHMVLFNRLERMKKESIGVSENGGFTRGKKLFHSGINNMDFSFTDNYDNFTMLGAMMNNSLFLTKELTKNMFLENTDKYHSYVNAISEQFGEKHPISEDNIKLISNYIYPYILAQSGHKLYNITEEDVEYLKKDFLTEFTRFKNANKDIQLFRLLRIEPVTNLISFPGYKYIENKDKSLIKEEFEEFYNKNTLNREFVHKLVQYSFLTTGFKPTFFSMNEYLPKSYFLNTGNAYYMQNLINSYNNDKTINQRELTNMMKFMAINNDKNFKVVKTMYISENISSKPLIGKIKEKVTIKNKNKFFPFVRRSTDKNVLFMLTDIIRDPKSKELSPIYTAIYNNTEVADSEIKTKRKTRIKLFDLNTIKPENLFTKEEDFNKDLHLQNITEYVSELDTIVDKSFWNVKNDNVLLSTINEFEVIDTNLEDTASCDS